MADREGPTKGTCKRCGGAIVREGDRWVHKRQPVFNADKHAPQK